MKCPCGVWTSLTVNWGQQRAWFEPAGLKWCWVSHNPLVLTLLHISQICTFQTCNNEPWQKTQCSLNSWKMFSAEETGTTQEKLRRKWSPSEDKWLVKPQKVELLVETWKITFLSTPRHFKPLGLCWRHHLHHSTPQPHRWGTATTSASTEID